MKIIGITGGIGSGKSTVVKMFKDLAIPVYVADARAKELMQDSKELKADIIQLLGKNAYINGKLNRKFIASEVFTDQEKLNALNAIVHPAVHKDFRKWIKEQDETVVSYCIYEAAILFESGRQHICDSVILVTAPQSVRIDRVVRRDNVSRDQVLERMSHQWSEEEKKQLADIVIENINLHNTKRQVQEVHRHIFF